MHLVRILALGLALTPMASLSLAQDPPPIEHDFSDADRVEGNIPSSDTAFIRTYRRGARTSLIRPRQTFVPELLKSVESQ